jgi:hypothetical protein
MRLGATQQLAGSAHDEQILQRVSSLQAQQRHIDTAHI